MEATCDRGMPRRTASPVGAAMLMQEGVRTVEKCVPLRYSDGETSPTSMSEHSPHASSPEEDFTQSGGTWRRPTRKIFDRYLAVPTAPFSALSQHRPLTTSRMPTSSESPGATHSTSSSPDKASTSPSCDVRSVLELYLGNAPPSRPPSTTPPSEASPAQRDERGLVMRAAPSPSRTSSLASPSSKSSRGQGRNPVPHLAYIEGFLAEDDDDTRHCKDDRDEQKGQSSSPSLFAAPDTPRKALDNSPVVPAMWDETSSSECASTDLSYGAALDSTPWGTGERESTSRGVTDISAVSKRPLPSPLFVRPASVQARKTRFCSTRSDSPATMQNSAPHTERNSVERAKRAAWANASLKTNATEEVAMLTTLLEPETVERELQYPSYPVEENKASHAPKPIDFLSDTPRVRHEASCGDADAVLAPKSDVAPGSDGSAFFRDASHLSPEGAQAHAPVEVRVKTDSPQRHVTPRFAAEPTVLTTEPRYVERSSRGLSPRITGSKGLADAVVTFPVEIANGITRPLVVRSDESAEDAVRRFLTQYAAPFDLGWDVVAPALAKYTTEQMKKVRRAQAPVTRTRLRDLIARLYPLRPAHHPQRHSSSAMIFPSRCPSSASALTSTGTTIPRWNVSTKLHRDPLTAGIITTTTSSETSAYGESQRLNGVGSHGGRRRSGTPIAPLPTRAFLLRLEATAARKIAEAAQRKEAETPSFHSTISSFSEHIYRRKQSGLPNFRSPKETDQDFCVAAPQRPNSGHSGKEVAVCTPRSGTTFWESAVRADISVAGSKSSCSQSPTYLEQGETAYHGKTSSTGRPSDRNHRRIASAPTLASGSHVDADTHHSYPDESIPTQILLERKLSRPREAEHPPRHSVSSPPPRKEVERLDLYCTDRTDASQMTADPLEMREDMEERLLELTRDQQRRLGLLHHLTNTPNSASDRVLRKPFTGR